MTQSIPPDNINIDYSIALPKPVRHNRSWSEIWFIAITQPNLAAYEDLLFDTNATANRAFGWLFSSILFTYILLAVFSALFNRSTSTVGNTAVVRPDGGTLLWLAICCLPVIAGIVAMLSFFVITFVHIVAGILQGDGELDDTAFVLAAFIAPLTIVINFAQMIPLVGLCLVFPIILYGFVLGVIGIKAAHRFTWLEATAAPIGGILLSGGMIFCCFLALSFVIV